MGKNNFVNLPTTTHTQRHLHVVIYYELKGNGGCEGAGPARRCRIDHIKGDISNTDGGSCRGCTWAFCQFDTHTAAWV